MNKNFHKKIGEQYIDKKEYGDVILEGTFQYPLIMVDLNSPIHVSVLNMINNSLEFIENGYSVYLRIKNQVVFIGYIDLNIDNIFKLEGVLERLDYNLYVKEDEDSDFKPITSKDLIGTIVI